MNVAFWQVHFKYCQQTDPPNFMAPPVASQQHIIIMNVISLPSPANISNLKSLGDAIINLLDSLMRVNLMHELRRNYKHHLIEIPDILSMGPSYIPLYSILELPATGLFISFTNNQIQSESSMEIVVGGNFQEL